MATTKNYGLYVTEPADDILVQTWRTRICGSTESNMVIIDEALAGLNEKTLPAVSEADEDKILKVTGGAWTPVNIGNASGNKY